MGRTNPIASIIQGLERRIDYCNIQKKRILGYIDKIKNQYLDREITYSEYEDLLQEKRNGKTLQEWLDYYDSYIEYCEEKIREERRKSIKKKIFLMLSSLVIISLLIFSGFYLSPRIIGLIVQAPQEYTETLNLEYTETQDYTWNLENPGLLESVKISGSIEQLENGNVKIYFDKLLILDSNNTKE